MGWYQRRVHGVDKLVGVLGPFGPRVEGGVCQLVFTFVLYVL